MVAASAAYAVVANMTCVDGWSSLDLLDWFSLELEKWQIVSLGLTEYPLYSVMNSLNGQVLAHWKS